MGKYQGHKNWNHWNVALWLNNDETLYRFCKTLIRQEGSKHHAAHEFMCRFRGQKTPDGAPYTFSSIRAAMVGM